MQNGRTIVVRASHVPAGPVPLFAWANLRQRDLQVRSVFARRSLYRPRLAAIACPLRSSVRTGATNSRVGKYREGLRVNGPTKGAQDVRSQRASLLRDFMYEALAPSRTTAQPFVCASNTMTTPAPAITSSGLSSASRRRPRRSANLRA